MGDEGAAEGVRFGVPRSRDAVISGQLARACLKNSS